MSPKREVGRHIEFPALILCGDPLLGSSALWRTQAALCLAQCLMPTLLTQIAELDWGWLYLLLLEDWDPAPSRSPSIPPPVHHDLLRLPQVGAQ